MIPAEELANKFHDEYERLAPQFGYETREETRTFNKTSPNGRLMIAVCSEVIDWLESCNKKEPMSDKKAMHVRVRLADAERTLEWREVEAASLDEAVKVAELMDDVEVVLEASTIPGGVVT